MMNIKFLKLDAAAILPTQAHDTDTGYDLYSVESVSIPARGSAIVNTGLQVGYIEPGYWFHIMPRSGLGFKHGIQPHLGVVDQGYRGSLGVKLYNFSHNNYTVPAGSKIAQLIFYPLIKADMSWTTEIENTDRGENGFGSSDKQS